MLQITVCHSKNSIKSIETQGHANAGSKGSDIVCAAVSILMHTYFVALYQIAPQQTKMQDDKEKMLISFSGTHEHKIGLDMYLQTGIKLLADTYPNNIQIDYKEL